MRVRVGGYVRYIIWAKIRYLGDLGSMLDGHLGLFF